MKTFKLLLAFLIFFPTSMALADMPGPGGGFGGGGSYYDEGYSLSEILQIGALAVIVLFLLGLLTLLIVRKLRKKGVK